MAKHLRLEIADEALGVTRDEAAIAAEAALDGLYVLRTSVGPERLAAPDVARAYKTRDRVAPAGVPEAAFAIAAIPTALQARALALLELTPASV